MSGKVNDACMYYTKIAAILHIMLLANNPQQCTQLIITIIQERLSIAPTTTIAPLLLLHKQRY